MTNPSSTRRTGHPWPLEPDEQLLWAGQPRRGLVLRPGDAVLIPLSVIVAGLAVFYEASVVAGHASRMAVLWGAPLLVVGLHLAVGRFVVDALDRRDTRYGVTDRRVLIRDDRLGPDILTTLELASLPAPAVSVRRDGAGTITFGGSPRSARYRAALGLRPRSRRPARFDLIDEAHAVAHLIEQARHAAPPA